MDSTHHHRLYRKRTPVFAAALLLVLPFSATPALAVEGQEPGLEVLQEPPGENTTSEEAAEPSPDPGSGSEDGSGSSSEPETPGNEGIEPEETAGDGAEAVEPQEGSAGADTGAGAEAEPAPVDQAAAPDAAAQDGVFRVTNGYDFGPGSLREAYAQAALTGAAAEILIDAGLVISLEKGIAGTAGVPVTFVVADGGRALIRAVGNRWGDPPGSGIMFIPTGGLTMNNIDLDGAGKAMSGVYAWTNQSTVSAFNITNSTFTGFTSNAIRVQGTFGTEANPVTTLIDGVTITNSGAAGYSDSALHFSGNTHFVVRNSTFRNNPGSLAYFHGDRATPESKAILENNTFVGMTQETSCVIVDYSVLNTPEDPPRTDPYVVFRNNTVADCNVLTGGREDLAPVALYFGDNNRQEKSHITTGVHVEGNTVSNSTGRDSNGFLYMSLGPTPVAEETITFVNNTVIGDPSNGKASIVYRAGAGTTASMVHNTLLGGGVQLSSPPDTQIHDPEIPLRVRLLNTVIDSGSEPAFEKKYVSPDWTYEVEAEGNAVTTLGDDLPASAGSEYSRAEFGLGEPALNENPFAPLTLLPATDSPLVDAAVATPLAPAQDQRGKPRPMGAAPDIGAVEVQEEIPLPPVKVTLDQDVSVVEGETAEFTVSRSAAPGSPASVTVSSRDGSATATTDYAPVSIPATWTGDEQDPITIQVTTVKRTGAQGERTFELVLSDPAEGTELGATTVVTGTITDADDSTPPGPDPDPDPDPDPKPTPPPGGGTPGTGGTAHGPLARTGGPGAGSAWAAVIALVAGGGLVLASRRFWPKAPRG